MNVQTVAKQILDNMEYRTRENGDRFYCLKDGTEWQTDIIRAAHLDRMPTDDIYSRIHEILEVIANADEDADEESVRDLLYEIESDVYTADLTKWLASNINNIYYLNEALEETDTNDGFQLLAVAQSKYIQEIGNELLSAISKYVEETEE